MVQTPQTQEEKVLLQRIKSAIQEIEPNAELYLFGSHSRGDATEESDWDVLVLVDGEVTMNRKVPIWNSVYPLELEYSICIGLSVRGKDDWRTNGFIHATPFYQTVSKDAILI